MKTFPEGMKYSNEYKRITESQTVSSLLFGNRFHSDQTMYEYLIEFLLIFVSAKDPDLQSGKMQFHNNISQDNKSYWVEPRMGLRRFVFYDKARKNGSIPADEDAYQYMIEIIFNHMDSNISYIEGKEYIESLQDLLRGYAVVIKKRSWCAQAILPICPELIFCGAMPNEKNRRIKVDWNINPKSVDLHFDLDKRNFLARGGELYYMHILHSLENNDHNNDRRNKLEMLIRDLLGGSNNKISKITSYIQDTWEEHLDLEKTEISKRLSLSFIPDEGYIDCEQYTVDELISYLSCELHPINRFEILAKGIMFQIMRMMSCRVYNFLGIENKKWIIDMKGSSTNAVKKIAAESYSNFEDDFMTALNKKARDVGVLDVDMMKKVRRAKSDSLDIFRLKGKELQCIIPTNGPFERFTLSEDIIRFLVLALILPGEKMTLNMFLEKLYEHYGIVIGPNEYRKSIDSNSIVETSLTNNFNENVLAFQNFLRSTGFLRELSDATSIVINPYTSVLRRPNNEVCCK